MIRRRAHISMRRDSRSRPSFTLVELMIVISILAILASATLFALFGVMEDVRETRTRSQIARIHEMLITRWDNYQGRAIPININPAFPAFNPGHPGYASNPGYAKRVAGERLEALRELMRMEFPDRKSDIVDDPVVLIAVRENPTPPPQFITAPNRIALLSAYRRQALASLRAHLAPTPLPAPPNQFSTWTEQHQGAECLYLIISTIQDGEINGLDFFRPAEIGDVDEDGMKELLDGWGKPIGFLRWAPGFLANSDIQVRDSNSAPDPLDPLRADPRWTPTDGDFTNDPFALYPLIFSAGRDGVYDIAVDYGSSAFKYSAGNRFYPPPTTPPPVPANSPPYVNDPYHTDSANLPTGFGANIGPGYDDNLTNHLLGAN